MLSLLNKAFEPSVSYPDKITYMTSVRFLQSIHSDNTSAVVEKLSDLLTSKNTRLQGLQFLEIALQQSPEIYLKSRWTFVLYDIIKEPVSSILKEHACKIFCILIPFMTKDAGNNEMELQKFASYLFPYLLSEIENSVEWVEYAGMCLSACLKFFPQALEPHRDRLLHVLYKQISHCVSPKTFEVFAECFCYIPSCLRQDDPNICADNWTNHYLTTLNTMHYLLNIFLTFLSDDPFLNTSVPDVGVFPFVHEDDNDVYQAYMKGVRRFLNLSRCLAKMLSTKSKFAVQVPIKLTLELISRLFQVQDIAKISPSSIEMQIVVSTLSQMQIASLVILESLILNFNIVPYSFLISEMMLYALQSSNLSNISSESISPLRQAVWTLLDQWISLHGAKVSFDLVNEQSLIFEELFRDISIATSDSQRTSMLDTCCALSSKSMKSLALNSGHKTFATKSKQAVCKKALKTLENLLYSAANFISKKLLQEIFAKVVPIAYAITPQEDYPFPYGDHMCRKHLYSALLAIAVVTKIDQREPIQYAVGIFKKGLSDPNSKVARVCHKAMAICRLYLHPKKPMPPIKDYDFKKKRSANSISEARFTEWATDDYVQNLPPVESLSNASENTSPRIVQTYQNPNEDDITSEEYMQQDAHYSEQASENQCNGEDILEIQNSSQCQDDDSDEEEEEDDEDEDQSYGDEEMNQEIDIQEHLYIPSTSKIQVMNSVSISSDTEQNVDTQDYEELRPCGKNEDKNSNLNGVDNNLVIEEEMSSPSIQNVASENGIYDGYDEEDDVEDEEVDEEDEEEGAMYPGEKRVPEYLEAPASKKQKIEEVKEEPPRERDRSRSPTLAEMKADFVCEIDDVKS